MILRFLILFFIISSCAYSPGFKEEPTLKNKTKSPKSIGLEQNGVSLMFYNLNKMNVAALPKVEDVQKKNTKKIKQIT